MPKGSAEDKIIRRIGSHEGVGKGEAIRRAKGRGFLKQKGGHVKPTARGKKMLRKKKKQK